MNASPAPSHHSNASNTKQITTLDAFADFDDFVLDKPTGVTNASDTTLTSASSTIIPQSTASTTATTTTITKTNNKLNNDSFFNAFNDNFNDNLITKPKTVSNLGMEQLNNNKLAAFDAFAVSGGAATAARDTKLFDAFNDNFDDSFGSSTKPANSSNTLDNNFAKFDAFDVHNFSSDFGTAFNDSKPTNGNQSGKEPLGKQTDKFSADYSKPESYDADLEEALKRSMLDN